MSRKQKAWTHHDPTSEAGTWLPHTKLHSIKWWSDVTDWSGRTWGHERLGRGRRRTRSLMVRVNENWKAETWGVICPSQGAGGWSTSSDGRNFQIPRKLRWVLRATRKQQSPQAALSQGPSVTWEALAVQLGFYFPAWLIIAVGVR